MKKLRRALAFIMTVAMLAGITAFAAPADDVDMITVSLRIEGIKESLYYNAALRIPAGSSVADLIKQVSGTDGAPKITITESTYGAYVSEIGGLAEFAYGEMSGWNYRVNNVEPSFGIGQYKLVDKDSAVIFYGDPFGVGMQHPAADWSRLLSEGIISFSSTDTVYGPDWTPTLVERPVAGAKVLFRWDDYVTNDKGEIKVFDKTGLAGFRALQIERYDEKTGVPTVLRFAPGYEIFVPFADTITEAGPAWYDEAVRFCVREEYFIGTDFAANLFAPMRKMTMAQLVAVLFRIAGSDVDASMGEQWYVEPLIWAVANKILDVDEDVVKEGIGPLFELTSGMNVTREEFIHMFYLTAKLVGGGYDMTVAADITRATDFKEIKGSYVEAISWAVASGIIRGTTLNELTISPKVEVNRVTVCQMLYNYYNS